MPKVVLTQYEKDVLYVRGQVHMAIAEKDMSQADVAKRLGCSQASVSRMLSNIERLKISDLIRIAEATGRRIIIQKKGGEDEG